MTPCQLLQKQAWRRDQCVLACLPCSFVSHRAAYTQAISSRRSGVAAVSMSGTVLGRRVTCKLTCMEYNTNNISSACLHGSDQPQRRSETSEKVDLRRGQNARSCRYLPV